MHSIHENNGILYIFIGTGITTKIRGITFHSVGDTFIITIGSSSEYTGKVYVNYLIDEYGTEEGKHLMECGFPYELEKRFLVSVFFKK